MPSDSSSSSADDSRYSYEVSVNDDTSIESYNNEDRSHDEEGSSNVIDIMDDMICSTDYTVEKNDSSIHSSCDSDNDIDTDGGESDMPEQEENNDCNKEEHDTSYVSDSQSQRSCSDVVKNDQMEIDYTIENDNDDEEDVGSLGKKLYPIRIPQDNNNVEKIEDDDNAKQEDNKQSDIDHGQSFDDDDDNSVHYEEEEEEQPEEIASNDNDQPIPEVKDSAPDNDEYLTPSILHAKNEDDECLTKSLLEQQQAVPFEEDVECARIVEDDKEIKTTHSPLLASMNDIEAQKNIQNPKTESRIRKARNRRKRVKHRHCKAFIMVFCIWGTTIILISIVLGMDKLWWGTSVNDQFSIDESGCTLCGENGLKFGADDVMTEPTPSKQPSHWINQLPSLYQLTTALPYEESTSTIKQPPDNLFEICSPSIHLHPSMLEDCIRTCTPALCCLKDNEDAQEGLISMLESIGISGSQATIYLSTISDCYKGDDIPVCDVYNQWCATLYDLDYVLEESLPTYFDLCSEEQTQQQEEDEEEVVTATIIAYERSFDRITTYNNECEQSMCQQVACCYDNMHDLNNRKRQRQHKPNEDNEVSLRRRLSEVECQHFNTQRLPLKAEICNVYAPFCNQSYMLESKSVYPSLEPSGVPTHIQSLTPSIQISKLPSTQPSSSTLPTSDNPTDQPESPSIPPSVWLSDKLNTTQPSVSKTPSSAPSLQPSSNPSSRVSVDPLASNSPPRGPTLSAVSSLAKATNENYTISSPGQT